MMSKKMLAGLAGLIFSANLVAGGIYDGVWMTSQNSDYTIIYQNGNELLWVSVYYEELDGRPDMDGWNALIGTIDGNTAVMSTLLNEDGEYATATVTFTSPTEGTVTVHSCSGCEDEDEIELGSPIYMYKIF